MSKNNRSIRAQHPQDSQSHTSHRKAFSSQPHYPGGWTEVAKAVAQDIQRGVFLGNTARLLFQESNSPVIDPLSMITWGLWGAGSYCALKYLMGQYGQIYRGEASSSLLNRNADVWRQTCERLQQTGEQHQSLHRHPA